MSSQVVFLQKTRNSRSEWVFLVDNKSGSFAAPDGCLTIQIGSVVEYLLKVVKIQPSATLISPQLNSHCRDELLVLFPSMRFMIIRERSIERFFARAMEQVPTQTRRRNQNVLYIGTDASSNVPKHDIDQTHAAWAWCVAGPKGSYDFGYAGAVDNNVAELQGIMQAIISNTETTANRIHIYSDSSTAIDMFNYDLKEGIIPREARKYGLVSVAQETIAVMKEIPISVEWVKGHRRHRLNMIADSISRTARVRFAAGHHEDEVAREIDILYKVFNQSVI